MDDYFVRYGDNVCTSRTDYEPLEKCIKFFNKLKSDSKVIWAEIIHEPLDLCDEQIVVDNFEKQTINMLGKQVVVNIE